MGASLLSLAKHILIPSRGSVMSGDTAGAALQSFYQIAAVSELSWEILKELRT